MSCHVTQSASLLAVRCEYYKLRTLAGAHTLSSSSMTASGDPEIGREGKGRGKLDAMIQE